MRRFLIVFAGLAITAPTVADDLYVLVGNVNPSLRKLDPVNGNIIESFAVTGQQSLFGGLAADLAGNIFSLDGYNDEFPDRLFAIDKATGVGSIVGPTGFNWNFRSLCLNPVNGTLYAATDNNLYTVNTATGAATLVTPISGVDLDQLTALAINTKGRAFITDIGGTDLFALDLQTGQATRIASIGDSGNWFNDLAFDSAGVLHGARTNGGTFTINTVTGAIASEFPALFSGLVYVPAAGGCYANCDASTAAPTLNINDFNCFLNRYAAQESYANCDGSTAPPILNVNDFNCFLNAFAAGCG